MNISGIYKIVNLINDKYYVGSSIDIIDSRWKNHVQKLNSNCHFNDYLQNSWNKYGENNFQFLIVERVSPDNLLKIEQKYLDIAKTEPNKCYNLNFIAKGGYSGFSEYSKEKHKVRVKLAMNNTETKEKIRKSKTGKVLSEKTKNKISNSLVGKPKPQRTIEHNEKIRVSLFGKFHTEETKKKMSILKNGHEVSNETKLKISTSNSKIDWKFLSPTKEICEFKNLKKFCKENGLNQSAMWRVYNKKLNHHRGWTRI